MDLIEQRCSFKETNLFILRNVRFVYLKRWQFHSAAHWHRKCGRSGHHRTRQHSSMCPLRCYQSLVQLPKRTRGDILSISLVFLCDVNTNFFKGFVAVDIVRVLRNSFFCHNLRGESFDLVEILKKESKESRDFQPGRDPSSARSRILHSRMNLKLSIYLART